MNNYFKKQEIESETGKIKVFSYEELGNDKFGILTDQYALVKSDLHHLSGECNTKVYAVRFRIISILGVSKIISCSSISDGKEDSENYKKIFPEKIINILNKNYNEYV